ncbi:MAG TPA: hypothetical protein PLU80_24200, partial [Acidobacteriota bacterium]|nr:hypothetical protein [Acidobacteriota bacterium]
MLKMQFILKYWGHQAQSIDIELPGKLKTKHMSRFSLAPLVRHSVVSGFVFFAGLSCLVGYLPV